MKYRKAPISGVGVAIAAALAVAAAGAFATPGFAANGTAPPMPQPGDTTAVLAPLTQAGASQPSRSGLELALSGPLSAAGLGPNVRVAVFDTESGNLAYERSSASPATPASTDKLLTAAAVLAAYGADYRIKTTVVRGTGANEVVLVGGGDPLLASKRTGSGIEAPASLDALAEQTAQALKVAATSGAETPAKISATVSFDDSLFKGPRTAPSWPATYVASNLVSPITALMVDGGGGADPSLIAANKFASMLKARGVAVASTPTRVSAPTAQPELAAVTSAPLSASVGHTLAASDNTAAEVLGHLAGVKNGGEGSFEGGTRAVNRTLAGLGISTDGVRLFDGSGLSRDDEVPARTLGQLLNKVATTSSDQLWPITYGIPIAGFTGTLAARFVLPGTKPGRGEVRGKTGTLTGVSALAGFVTDNDGTLLTYVLMAPQATDIIGAQVAWDRATAALAQCGCK